MYLTSICACDPEGIGAGVVGYGFVQTRPQVVAHQPCADQAPQPLLRKRADLESCCCIPDEQLGHVQLYVIVLRSEERDAEKPVAPPGAVTLRI